MGGSGEADDHQNEQATDEQKAKHYKAKVRLHHDYFLATMLNFRSTQHFCFDIVLVITAMAFFFGAMNNLYRKGLIENYH